jgi:hypothetical protein
MVRNCLRLLLVGLATMATLSACRNRPGIIVDELPDDVQKAVDEVVAQLEAASQAVGGAVEAFASVDVDPDDDLFDDCPEVVFVREDNVSTFGLTFEPGCESEYYDGLSVSGSIRVVFDRNAQAFDADFDAFTVEDQSSTGELHVSRTEGGDLRSWSGSIDLATTGVGSVVGDIVLVVNVVTQTITIEFASLELAHAAGAIYSIEVEGVVIRPVANQSFIPQAGTVTLAVPNTSDEGPETLVIVIEFDENSPDDGTVRVTFGEGTVENYPLTGF